MKYYTPNLTCEIKYRQYKGSSCQRPGPQGYNNEQGNKKGSLAITGPNCHMNGHPNIADIILNAQMIFHFPNHLLLTKIKTMIGM